MLKFFHAFVAVMLAVAMVACEPDTPQQTVETESVITLISAQEIEFLAEGGEGTITYVAFERVVSRSEDVPELVVEASCDAEWVTITATDFEKCNFEVAANEGEARETKITVRYADKSVEVAVKQAAKVEAPAPVLTLTSEADCTFTADGGEGTITYTLENAVEGTELTAECDAEWVSNITVGENITFEVAANAGDERNTKIVVAYGELGFEVGVKQEAKPVEAPRVGDIYYSDGTWSKELDETKTPIGVVFCIGAGNNDSATYYKNKTGVKFSEIKGYVVALKDATNGVNDNEGVTWSFYDGWYNGAGCSKEIDDFLGYTNTQSIKQAALRDDCPAGEFNGTEQSFPAAWYASDGYELMVASPESSSGWYLPSAYQLKYIFDKVYFKDDNMYASVENTLLMLKEKGLADEMYVRDSEYWTSTEHYDSYGDSSWAYYVCFDSAMIDPGFIANYNKYAKFRIRAILTF